MDISANLQGFSKALYATWLHFKPDNLLVDCGEGAATTLGNGGFALQRILLTHGHIDHIAGLPPLLWSRANGMGDTQKPLEIFHPRGDEYVADMRAYIEKTGARLPFALRWTPLEAGARIALGDEKGEVEKRHARFAQTFATRHMKTLTLGYKIVETRSKLKREYSQMTPENLRALAARGEELSENYYAILCAFGGDGLPLAPDNARGAELLVHEATLLDAADRKNQAHSTLDEAVEVATAAQVKALLLIHISGRYAHDDVRRAIDESRARHGADFPIWYLLRERFYRADNAASPD